MTTWRHLLILALFSAAGAAYGQRVYPVDLDLRKQQHPFTVEAAGRTSVRIEARILNNGGAYLSASNWTGTFFFAPSSTSAVGTAISAASPSGHVFTVDIPQQYTSATGTYFAQFIFTYPGMTQEWSRGTFRLLASAGTGEYGEMAWNSTNNALAGDVTGIYSNNRVSAIGGIATPTNEPTSGDAIVYDGTKLVYQSAGASGVELDGDVTGPATNTTVGKLLGWPILTNAISAYYIPFWIGGNIEFRNPYLYWPSSNAFDTATNTLAGQVARYPVTAGSPTTGDFLRWSAGYWDHIDASIYFLSRNGGTTTNLTVDGTLAVVTNLTIGSTPLPWLQLSTDGSTSYMQGQNGAMEIRDNSGIAALRLTSDRERILYDGNGARIAQVGYFNGVGHESTLWLYRPLYAPTATISSLTGTVVRAATSGGLQIQSMAGSTCAVFGAGSGCNVSFGDGATFQGTVTAPTVTVVNAYATRTNLPIDRQQLLTYGDYLDLLPADMIYYPLATAATPPPGLSGLYQVTTNAAELSATNRYISVTGVTNGQYAVSWIEKEVDAREAGLLAAGKRFSGSVKFRRTSLPSTAISLRGELYAVETNGTIHADLAIGQEATVINATTTTVNDVWIIPTNAVLPTPFRLMARYKAEGVTGSPDIQAIVEGSPLSASHFDESGGSTGGGGGVGTITGVEITGGTSVTSETGVVTLTAPAGGGGGRSTSQVFAAVVPFSGFAATNHNFSLPQSIVDIPRMQWYATNPVGLAATLRVSIYDQTNRAYTGMPVMEGRLAVTTVSSNFAAGVGSISLTDVSEFQIFDTVEIVQGGNPASEVATLYVTNKVGNSLQVFPLMPFATGAGTARVCRVSNAGQKLNAYCNDTLTTNLITTLEFATNATVNVLFRNKVVW